MTALHADEIIPSITRHAEVDETWKADARCRPGSPDERERDFFFPEKGQARGALIAAFCKECPVREQCLDYSIITSQKHGAWGGVSERERRRLRVSRNAKRTLLQEPPRRRAG